MSLCRPIVGLLAALLLILPGGGVAQVYETLATARAVVASVAPYPGYLQQVTDAAFGTPFMRVTGPGRQMLPGIFCKPTYCTHRYSSSRAWNADQSLLLIANGCSGFCFPDGSTYNGIYTVSTSRCIPPQLLWAATAAWHGPVQQSLWRCRLSDKQVRRQKDFIT